MHLAQRTGLLLCLALLLGLPVIGEAADCSSDNIVITTQSEIDNFQTIYGPCDTVGFFLGIGPSFDITNLDGLAGLVNINFLLLGGNSILTDITGLSTLQISDGILIENNALSNLNGLGGLQTLGSLNLNSNPVLSNIDALSSLTSMGNLLIGNNDALTNLDALSGLVSIGTFNLGDSVGIANLDSLSGLMTISGDIIVFDNPILTDISGLSLATGFQSLEIRGNPMLTSIDGIQGATSLTGLIIEDNDMLTDLDPLAGLASVGNLNPQMRINDNDILVNLEGLSSLVSLDANLYLNNNPALGMCGALASLLDDVDDDTPGPGPGVAGIPDINGDVTIAFNAMGCNSIEEIVGGGGPVDCTPANIALSNQIDVDGFQTNHGPCDRIVGFLSIGGGDINNLDGLAGITEIGGGNLNLGDNEFLTSVSGLSNLTSISAYLQVFNNLLLGNLNGLNNLNNVGTGIAITDNTALQNISALSSITNASLDLQVARNPQLMSLDGLQGLAELDGLILEDNDALPDVDGLAGLTAVDNLHSEMTIAGNGVLTNLDGLATLVSVNNDVGIRDNPMLDECSALSPLMDDVDDALPGPGPGVAGIPDINGNVDLQNNLTGCNSVEEITDVDTEPPVVTAPPDVSGIFATAVLTSVDLGMAMVTDNSGEMLIATPDNPGPFPVGTTTVTWTAMDSSGNVGSDTQSVTIGPPSIEVPGEQTPDVDGRISPGEWSGAATFALENGVISFLHDRNRLYILINLLGDDGDDPFSTGGGDQFWLHFDIDEDDTITPNVDLRYRLESGTGNLRWQTYCDDCPLSFNPLEPQALSARGEGFGCFFADGSRTFLPTTCNPHRVWELGLDLTELAMDSDLSTQLGFLVVSGAPLFNEGLPTNLDHMFNYAALTLLGSVNGPGPAPGAMSPLFEVTQSIQTPNNDVDLVSGKRTAVRIWDNDNTLKVRTFTFGSRNGTDLPGSPLMDFSTLRGSNPSWVRDSVVSSSFTILPNYWSAGGAVDFEVKVFGQDGSLAAMRSDTINFVSTRTPVFWTVPVRIEFPENAFTEPQENLITNQEQWLQLMAPIESIDIVRRPELKVFNVNTSAAMKEALNNYDMLTILMWTTGLEIHGIPPFDLPEQTTGFTGQSLASTNLTAAGSSDRVGKGGRGRITWARASSSNLSMLYVHELNHNLDRGSTSTWGLHSRGCNAQAGGDLDTEWPYGDSFEIQEPGIWPLDLRFETASADTPDFMSYCRISQGGPDKWWSPYRWQAWVDEFQNVAPGPAIDGPLPAPEDSFYIQGRVYPDDSGEFVNVIRQPGLPDAVEVGGDYEVRVLDCGNMVLEENSFNVTFIGDEGEEDEFAGFTVVLPAPVTGCSIELSLNDVILESRTISANPPLVTLLTPNGGENWSGTETISWTANDPDGDPLSYSLFYSIDDGMTWLPIAGMIDGSSYEVDSTQYPGTTLGRIRVMVSDGANTSHDESDDAFTIPDKPPTVAILSPEDGAFVSATFSTGFSGYARDDQGRIIPPENLLWSVDGEIVGTGTAIPVTLDPGLHDIDLDVLEGEAIVTTTSIQVMASDAPGTFGFDASQYTVDEQSGEVALTVNRSGGVGGDASLLVETMDGIAISGGDPMVGEDDYVAITADGTNRIEWSDGVGSSATVVIVINLDNVTEGEETFQVLLTAVDDEVLTTSVATVRINSETAQQILKDGFE